MAELNNSSSYASLGYLLQSATRSIVQDSCAQFGNIFNYTVDVTISAYFVPVINANTSDTTLITKWGQQLSEYFSNVTLGRRLLGIFSAVCVDYVCGSDGRACNVSGTSFPCSGVISHFEYTAGIVNVTDPNLVACNNFLESTTSKLPVPVWVLLCCLALGALILVLISIISYKCCPQVRVTLVLSVIAGLLSLYFLAKFFIKLYTIMRGGYACNDSNLKLLFPIGIVLFVLALVNNWNLVRIFFNDEMHRSSLILSEELTMKKLFDGEKSFANYQLKRKSYFFRWYKGHKCGAWCIFALAGIVFDSILLINSYLFHASFFSAHLSEKGLAKVRILGIPSILLQNAPMLALQIYVSQQQTGFTTEVVAVMSINLALLLFSLLKRGIVIGTPGIHHCLRNACLRCIRATRTLGTPLSCSDKCGILCCFFSCCVGRRLLRKSFRVLAKEKLPCLIDSACCCCPIEDETDVTVNDDGDFEQELNRDHEDDTLTPSEILWRESHLANEIYEDDMAQLTAELIASRTGRHTSDRLVLNEQLQNQSNSDNRRLFQLLQANAHLLHAEPSKLIGLEAKKRAELLKFVSLSEPELLGFNLTLPLIAELKHLKKRLLASEFVVLDADIDTARESTQEKVKSSLSQWTDMYSKALYQSEQFAAEMRLACFLPQEHDSSTMSYLVQTHMKYLDKMLDTLAFDVSSDIELALLDSDLFNKPLALELPSTITAMAHTLAQDISAARRERYRDDFSTLMQLQLNELEVCPQTKEAIQELAEKHQIARAMLITKWKDGDSMEVERILENRAQELKLSQRAQREQDDILQNIPDSEVKIENENPRDAVERLSKLDAHISVAKLMDFDQQERVKKQNFDDKLISDKVAAFREIAEQFILLPNSQRDQEPAMQKATVELLKLDEETRSQLERLQMVLDDALSAPTKQLRSNVISPEVTIDMDNNSEIAQAALRATHDARIAALRHECDLKCLAILESLAAKRKGIPLRQSILDGKNIRINSSNELQRLLSEMEAETKKLEAELSRERAAQRARILANRRKKIQTEELELISNNDGNIELQTEPSEDDSILRELQADHESRLADLRRRYQERLKMTSRKIEKLKSDDRSNFQDEIDRLLREMEAERARLDAELRYSAKEAAIRAAHEAKLKKMRKAYHEKITSLLNRPPLPKSGFADSELAQNSDQIARLLDEMAAECARLDSEFDSNRNVQRLQFANRKAKHKLDKEQASDTGKEQASDAATLISSLNNLESNISLDNNECSELASRESKLRADYEMRMAELRRKFKNAVVMLEAKIPVKFNASEEEFNRLMAEMEAEQERLSADFHRSCSNELKLILASRRKQRSVEGSFEAGQDTSDQSMSVSNQSNIINEKLENNPGKSEAELQAVFQEKLADLRRDFNNRISLLVSNNSTNVPKTASISTRMSQEIDRMMSEMDLERQRLQYEFEHNHLSLREQILARKRKKLPLDRSATDSVSEKKKDVASSVPASGTAPLVDTEGDEDVPILLVLPDDVESEEERLRREHQQRMYQLRKDYEAKLQKRPVSARSPLAAPKVGNFAATILSQIDKLQQQHDDELAIISAFGQIQKTQQLAQVTLNLQAKRRAKMSELQQKQASGAQSNDTEKQLIDYIGDQRAKLTQLASEKAIAQNNIHVEMEILRRAEKAHVTMLLQDPTTDKIDFGNITAGAISTSQEKSSLPALPGLNPPSEGRKIGTKLVSMDDFIKMARQTVNPSAESAYPTHESDHNSPSPAKSTEHDQYSSLPLISRSALQSVPSLVPVKVSQPPTYYKEDPDASSSSELSDQDDSTTTTSQKKLYSHVVESNVGQESGGKPRDSAPTALRDDLFADGAIQAVHLPSHIQSSTGLESNFINIQTDLKSSKISSENSANAVIRHSPFVRVVNDNDPHVEQVCLTLCLI